MYGKLAGMQPPLPPEMFARLDETPDLRFYALPRLVTHIDDTTIAALSQLYRERLPAGGDVLDLMSSWVSHLPPDVSYGRVAGLGMNAQELRSNPRLDDWCVHDLNRDPRLPYPEASFDAVINAVSIQYLVRPVEVFRSIRGVLRPGGVSLVAMSHRCFPSKAIRAFHMLGRDERLEWVSRYHQFAGGFDPPELLDRSPVGADPLWVVITRRADEPDSAGAAGMHPRRAD